MSKNYSLAAKAASPVRPGYLTTEFWITVFTQVIAAVVALSATFGDHVLDVGTLTPLIPVAALIAAGVAQAYYAHSRKGVKVAAIENGVNTVVPTPTVVNVTVPQPADPVPASPVTTTPTV